MFEKLLGQDLGWHWTVFKWCGRPFGLPIKYTGVMPIIRWHFYYRWKARRERIRRSKLVPMQVRLGREVQRS